MTSGVLALLVMSCRAPMQQDAPKILTMPPIVVAMRCGEEAALIVYQGERAELLYADAHYSLNQAISASGARYVSATTPTIEWWNKGQNAQLMVRGKRLGECVPEQSTGGVYRASGNEPFWRLDVRDEHVVYRPMEGPIVTTQLLGLEAMQGGIRLLGSDELQILILPTQCQDSMSGHYFPTTLMLHLAGEVLTGCGGTPNSANIPFP